MLSLFFIKYLVVKASFFLLSFLFLSRLKIPYILAPHQNYSCISLPLTRLVTAWHCLTIIGLIRRRGRRNNAKFTFVIYTCSALMMNVWCVSYPKSPLKCWNNGNAHMCRDIVDPVLRVRSWRTRAVATRCGDHTHPHVLKFLFCVHQQHWCCQ